MRLSESSLTNLQLPFYRGKKALNLFKNRTLSSHPTRSNGKLHPVHQTGSAPKGPRCYDWQRLALSATPAQDPQRWLLVRRSLSDPNELTAYIVFAPAPSSLAEQVRVAGMRWTVEESIQTAKGEVGLDNYEVRSWTGWYRHVTLAMWAGAFLSVIRKETGAEVASKKGARKRLGQSSLAAFKERRGLLSA